MKRSSLLLVFTALAVATSTDILTLLSQRGHFPGHPYGFKVEEYRNSTITTSAVGDKTVQTIGQNSVINFLFDSDNAHVIQNHKQQIPQNKDQKSNDEEPESTNETEPVLIDMRLIEDCSDFKRLKSNSVETLFIKADQVKDCYSEIKRVLNRKYGQVLLMDAHKTSYPSALSYLRDQKDMFNVTRRDISLRRNRFNCHSKPECEIFYTTRFIIDSLYKLLKEYDYVKVVTVTTSIYQQKPKIFCDTVVKKVTHRLLTERNYIVLNFAYKLIENGGQEIVDNCFPDVIKPMFSTDEVKIIDIQNRGALRLSAEEDSFQDRWLYSDCSDSTDVDLYWKVIPVWNSTFHNVAFKIVNSFYGYNLKLDVNVMGHNQVDRLAWGDHRAGDERYTYRLQPTGLTTEVTSFCIVSEVYDQCLTAKPCDYQDRRVTGVNTTCNSELGWLITKKI